MYDTRLFTFADTSISYVNYVDVPIDQKDAVFRFYNSANETHVYTRDPVEVEFIGQNLPTFVDEGVGLYGCVGNPPTGAHFFTVSEDERNFVLRKLPSYRSEGLVGWVFAL